MTSELYVVIVGGHPVANEKTLMSDRKPITGDVGGAFITPSLSNANGVADAIKRLYHCDAEVMRLLPVPLWYDEKNLYTS